MSKTKLGRIEDNCYTNLKSYPPTILHRIQLHNLVVAFRRTFFSREQRGK